MAPIAIQELQHDHIEADPRNPRQVCEEEQLVELANDIAVRGILQPIVVRPHPDKKGRFMIVFGERRWRAAGMLDAATVPCIVRQYDSELAVLEDQIAENGKRADVHPLEEADAYRRLHDEHGRDVEEIAELTGKSKKAGPCTTCPKRTGNQRELFADVVEDKRGGGADVCTDSTCYKQKLDVHWKRVAASAREQGRAVLEGKEAAHAGGYSDKKHIDLDAPAQALGEYNKSYREVLGKHAEAAVVAVARDTDGVKELIDRSALPKLVKEDGLKVKR